MANNKNDSGYEQINYPPTTTFVRLRYRHPRLLALAIPLLLGTSTAALSAPVTWTGGTGDWSVNTNWSTGVLPTVTDDVTIDNDVNTNSVVNQNVSTTVQSLVIDAGDSLNASNGVDLTISGTSITNNGTWTLNGTGSSTDFRFADGAVLNGTGSLVLGSNAVNANVNRILGISASDTLTNGVGHTIRGGGQLLSNFGNLVNDGTIIADDANNALVVDPSGTLANNGVMRATGVAGMTLNAGTFSNNTTIEAANGSRVDIDGGTVVGGTLLTSGTGLIDLNNATLTNLTSTASLQQTNNADSTITGTITNNGTWLLNGTTSTTDFRFTDGAVLSGTGSLVLGNGGVANVDVNRIYGVSATDTLTNGAGHTIRGAGQLLTNSGNLINNGSIIADRNDLPLIIDPNGSGILPGFVNNGTLSANGDAGLQVRPGVFTNNGSIDIASNSQLRSTTNTFRQITGSTTVNGKLNMVDSSLRIEGGTLSGNGTIQFIDRDRNPLTNGGVEVLGSAVVAPGDGGTGRLTINPSENLGYSMDIGSTLEIEIGGLLAGTEYDVLNIGGLASLGVYNSGAPFGSGGAAPGLDVTLVDGFVPTVGDTFDILTAIYFQGSFDNNKLSLPTVSGITFEMSYFGNLIGADFFGNGGQLQGGGVRLTAVSAVPVPAAAWLFLSGFMGLVAVARRRKTA